MLVTAALVGIKVVQISEAMAFMESFPPPYETVTVAGAESDEWQPTRLLSGTVRSPSILSFQRKHQAVWLNCPYKSGETVPEDAAVLVLFDDDVEAQRGA